MNEQVLAAFQGFVNQLQGIANATQSQIDADKVDAAAAQAKLDQDNANIAAATTGLDKLSSLIKAEQDLIAQYAPPPVTPAVETV